MQLTDQEIMATVSRGFLGWDFSAIQIGMTEPHAEVLNNHVYARKIAMQSAGSLKLKAYDGIWAFFTNPAIVSFQQTIIIKRRLYRTLSSSLLAVLGFWAEQLPN